MDIKRIVLTGGPCAGKTTALVRIIEHFSNLGFKVFTVPEVPTMYSQGGWSYQDPNGKPTNAYNLKRTLLWAKARITDQGSARYASGSMWSRARDAA